MNLILLRLSLGGAISLAFLPSVVADDKTDLPGNGFPASRYETLWLKSPFSVASPDASVADSPDYSLVGVAQFDGVSYASIIDKKNNQEHFLVSTGQDSHGLKLVSVTLGQNAGNTLATLQKNGASLVLKLDGPPPGGPGTAPPPILQMPETGPSHPLFRPAYVAPGEPPPVAYRPHMISPPMPPGGFHH